MKKMSQTEFLKLHPWADGKKLRNYLGKGEWTGFNKDNAGDLEELLECMGATERRCKQQRPTQRRRGNNTSFRLVYKWEHKLKPEWQRNLF